MHAVELMLELLLLLPRPFLPHCQAHRPVVGSQPAVASSPPALLVALTANDRNATSHKP